MKEDSGANFPFRVPRISPPGVDAHRKKLSRLLFSEIGEMKGIRLTLVSGGRRSSDRAAVDHAQLFLLPDGEPSGRELAEKRWKRMGDGQVARLRFTLPY